VLTGVHREAGTEKQSDGIFYFEEKLRKELNYRFNCGTEEESCRSKVYIDK